MEEKKVNEIMENITEEESLGVIRNALENFDNEKEHICCGEKMHKTPIQDMLSDTEGDSWTCLKCGSWYSEQTGQLDEEELENYKENYQEDYKGVKKC